MSIGLQLGGPRRNRMTWREKVAHISWPVVFLIGCVASIGFAMLYSAAHGSADPWMDRQAARFAVGLAMMFAVAMVDLKTLMRIAYPVYFVAILLLVWVDFAGSVGMGAQRWIDLGVVQLQPSEIMKVSIVLTLARYFHGLSYEDVGRPLSLIVPTVLVLVPAGLVLKQPDLGTAGMLLMVAGAIYVVVGVRWWKFALILTLGVGAAYYAWNAPNILHDYQKARIMTFMNPESDLQGAGYHITQSKIALGSGAVWGKGFLQGTQSHLDFLPERQTDFIFTMFAEEFGMVGSLALLGLYVLLVIYGTAIGIRCKNQFGRLLAFGLSFNLFCYFFINTAMVMGLIPVVGVPLPLISYGGTVLMTVLIGFGLILSVNIHREQRIGRRLGNEDA
ncbi:MAG TPA: rod shape-determining protein RodA [Dongiaceae bacterium]|jgi:rod shape determining protein RodA|nr:rod shape-determining protein RodA [Dongiaceae bacterium]